VTTRDAWMLEALEKVPSDDRDILEDAPPEGKERDPLEVYAEAVAEAEKGQQR